MAIVKHTHSKDCPDYKDAAADRKTFAAVSKEREDRQQVRAHAEWFEWFAPSDLAVLRRRSPRTR